jgi:hypothetical protein
MANKHRKVWEVIFRKPLSGQTNTLIVMGKQKKIVLNQSKETTFVSVLCCGSYQKTNTRVKLN